MLAVVLLSDGTLEGAHLKGDNSEAFALDPREDFTDESTLNAVGLNENQGALGHDTSFHGVGVLRSLVVSTGAIGLGGALSPQCVDSTAVAHREEPQDHKDATDDPHRRHPQTPGKN